MHGKVTAYIGLGSNLGDRGENLRQAIGLLKVSRAVQLKRVAPLYRTAPVGVTGQPEFFNTVAEITTSLSPRQLLARLLEIEQQLGRVRESRWGPRIIDLDLLLYDDLTINEPDLQVPHPRLTERAFAVVPLAALAPNLSLPGGLALAALAEELQKSQFIERVTGVDWAR